MRNLFIKLLAILLLFFGSWIGFSQIDWMRLLRVKHITEKTEKKLGEHYWNYFKQSQEEITDDQVYKPVDSLLTKLCKANDIDRTGLKLHILKNDDVNAFAIPGSQIIVLSGLLLECENEAELVGILGHELAHIQERHVMKKLTKEIGLSLLLSTATGGNGEVIRQSAKLLSSSAYDRSLEKAADQKAIDYLAKAQFPILPLANFLGRLGENEPAISGNLTWINTHPDPEERVNFIHQHINSQTNSESSFLNASTWTILQDFLITGK